MCVTMSCRWESSKRPLFVKSVWLNGYRHAILSNEDPILKKNIQSPRPPSVLNSDKRERPKSKTNGEQLTIPTVQLLLENVQRLKQESDKINKRPTKERLQKSLTFDVIMKNEMNKSAKVCEINLDNEKTLYSSFSCEKAGFHSDRFEQSSNSLTERVLLWLDLAGKYNKNQQENTFRSRNVRRDINKRISTAHVKDNFDIMHNNYDKTIVKNTEDLFNVQFYENVNETLNDYKMYKESSDNEIESHLTLTELMDEEDDYREVNIEPVKNKTQVNKSSTPNVSKRQMHIFIPNIINKIADTNIINETNNYLLNVEVI